MKKLTTTLLAGAFFVGCLGLAAPVLAGSYGNSDCPLTGQYMKKGYKKGCDDGACYERMLDKVNATDEQRAQIQSIADTARPELDALREKKRAASDKIRELVHSDSYDEVAISSLADEQAVTTKSKILLYARMKSDIHAVLTDEQREHLKQFKMKRQQKREER